MRTVLVLYASCGAGHRRAAGAIAAAHAEACDGAGRVILRDVLGFVPAWLRHLYRHGYLALVRHTPALWGALYRWSDGGRSPGNRAALLARVDRAAAGRRLADFIGGLAPDRIIATHFLPLELLSGGARAHGGLPPLTVVVTDYRAHALWAIPGADTYAVPSEPVALELHLRGVPADRIHVTGLPVDPVFARLAMERAGRIAVPPRDILILSGGGGVGSIAALTRMADRVARDATITVSAAGRPGLARRLERLARGRRNRVRVIGLVDRIDRMYATADVLITKPGGLTTTEAAVAGVPLILTCGIPGQEDGNARHFIGQGAALDGSTPALAAEALGRLYDEPDLAPSILRAQSRIARPEAAAAILRLAGAAREAAA